MAINRLRSPFNNMLAVTGDVGPAAYSNAQVGGSTPYTFIGSGATNTIVGVTYRVHFFTYTPGQTYSITFNRAGNVDLLVLAGGGGGGGGYYGTGGGPYGVSAGGGGGGGLILSYGYGVTASTYSLSVGKGGYNADGLGLPYHDLADCFAQNSVFGALTAIRGGFGRPSHDNTTANAQTGGSGGGSGVSSTSPGTMIAGAAGTAGQGNRGGNAAGYVHPYTGGGGGGYSTAGQDFVAGNTNGRLGGDGITLNFDGQSRTIAAGGGGGGYSGGAGGAGGSSGAGGAGGAAQGSGLNASGYGNGGGGCGYVPPIVQLRGGGGTDGLVIVRYPLG